MAMRVSQRKTLAVGLVAALGVFCLGRPPAVTESILPAGIETLTEGVSETAVLRGRAKRLLAREAADGRRSLVEAAALFGALNRLPPETLELALLDDNHWVLSDPVHTEGERLCRQVIQWVEALRITDSPEYADAAVARLTAEFREERRRHGVLRLPDPSTLVPTHELLEQARAALTESERQNLFGPRQPIPGGR
jgi:hypothetical protein